MLPRTALVAVVVVALLSLGIGQSNQTPEEYVESPTNTYWVSCGNGDSPYKSRTATSLVLVSPDGANQAFTRATANAINEGSCENESKIFLRDRRFGDYKLIFSQKPEEYTTGNGVRLVDWSPDGRFLLIEEALWLPEDSDNKILLYDARKGKFVQPDFNVVLKGLPKDCYTDVRARGFSFDQKIMVEATVHPYYEIDEEEPINPDCPTKFEKWLVAVDGSAQQVSKDFKIDRYGKLLTK